MFDFIITGLKFKELLKIRYFMRVPEVQKNISAKPSVVLYRVKALTR